MRRVVFIHLQALNIKIIIVFTEVSQGNIRVPIYSKKLARIYFYPSNLFLELSWFMHACLFLKKAWGMGFLSHAWGWTWALRREGSDSVSICTCYTHNILEKRCPRATRSSIRIWISYKIISIQNSPNQVQSNQFCGVYCILGKHVYVLHAAWFSSNITLLT